MSSKSSGSRPSEALTEPSRSSSSGTVASPRSISSCSAAFVVVVVASFFFAAAAAAAPEPALAAEDGLVGEAGVSLLAVACAFGLTKSPPVPAPPLAAVVADDVIIAEPRGAPAVADVAAVAADVALSLSFAAAPVPAPELALAGGWLPEDNEGLLDVLAVVAVEACLGVAGAALAPLCAVGVAAPGLLASVPALVPVIVLVCCFGACPAVAVADVGDFRSAGCFGITKPFGRVAVLLSLFSPRLFAGGSESVSFGLLISLPVFAGAVAVVLGVDKGAGRLFRLPPLADALVVAAVGVACACAGVYSCEPSLIRSFSSVASSKSYCVCV